MKKMLICMLLCSLLFGCLSGCGKDKKSSEKKTVERSVEKKSRNSNEEEDKAFFDAVSGIALFKEPSLMATYTGKSEEEIIEVNGKYISASITSFPHNSSLIFMKNHLYIFCTFNLKYIYLHYSNINQITYQFINLNTTFRATK